MCSLIHGSRKALLYPLTAVAMMLLSHLWPRLRGGQTCAEDPNELLSVATNDYTEQEMNRAIKQQERKISQRRCQRRGEHYAVAVYIL